MELANAGHVDLAAAFPHARRRGAYYVTDGFAGRTRRPFSHFASLLTLTPGGIADRGLLRGSVALTHFGRAVLTGQDDRIALCGIDRWLGGVHLHTDEDVWRWDEQRQRISRR